MKTTSKKSVSKTKNLTWVKKQLQEFFRTTPHIILGTGTSCAVDVGFGMTALKDNLLRCIEPSMMDKKSVAQWKKVKNALARNVDIEHALDYAVTPELREKILQITGASIAELDQKYAARICRGQVLWPAIAIIKKFMGGLEGSHQHELNVITTNYDLLFEYACVAQGITFIDGFCGSIVKKGNWPASQQMICQHQKVIRNKSPNRQEAIPPHVKLYKIHGSLNRFVMNDEVVSVDMWIKNPPADIERVIITPGSSKYEKIQKYRQELQAKADVSVASANGFLFLGYGMNDMDVEQYIKRRITKYNKPAVFVTMELNDRLYEFAKQNHRVWLCCGQDNPHLGSRIFNTQLGGWLQMPGKLLWDFAQFAEQMI